LAGGRLRLGGGFLSGSAARLARAGITRPAGAFDAALVAFLVALAGAFSALAVALPVFAAAFVALPASFVARFAVLALAGAFAAFRADLLVDAMGRIVLSRGPWSPKGCGIVGTTPWNGNPPPTRFGSTKGDAVAWP